MDYVIQDLTDGERIVLSANLLETSEFEIFRLAYRDWFGSDAQDPNLEAEFSHYLIQTQSPPWVRHYTRRLLQNEKNTISISSCEPASGTVVKRLLDHRIIRFLFG